MPDKWEYPWYAAWDLAFHVTALALVEIEEFGKHELETVLKSRYLHPNAQYIFEWNFGDVNPPVHA